MKEKENEHFLLKEINKKVDNLNKVFVQNKFVELIEVLGNRKKLFFNNLFSGIAKGVGIGIGITLITAILITLLQRIVTLNIPIIGEYVKDIVDIVEKSR